MNKTKRKNPPLDRASGCNARDDAPSDALFLKRIPHPNLIQRVLLFGEGGEGGEEKQVLSVRVIGSPNNGDDKSRVETPWLDRTAGTVSFPPVTLARRNHHREGGETRNYSGPRLRGHPKRLTKVPLHHHAVFSL